MVSRVVLNVPALGVGILHSISVRPLNLLTDVGINGCAHAHQLLNSFHLLLLHASKGSVKRDGRMAKKDDVEGTLSSSLVSAS